MSTPQDGPLSEDQKDQLIQKIKDARKVQADIDNAKRAGIDVTDQQAQLNAAVDQLMKLKSVYAPNKSIV